MFFYICFGKVNSLLFGVEYIAACLRPSMTLAIWCKQNSRIYFCKNYGTLAAG
jgi:hypothetical protein